MRNILPIACAFGAAFATSASAVTIDNDMTSGTLGSVVADVGTAGKVSTMNVTVDGAVSGLQTTQVIFDYLT